MTINDTGSYSIAHRDEMLTCLPNLLPVQLLRHPDIRLSGQINQETFDAFLEQLAAAQDKQGPLLLELTTLGGDADVAERIALDISLYREKFGVDMFFVGKTTIYSAGVTVMSAFPVARRFLTADATLLIHERRMDSSMQLNGPLRSCEAVVRDALAEVQMSQCIQRRGFERLIEGSAMSLEELLQRVMQGNWYLTADEAMRHQLIASII